MNVLVIAAHPDDEVLGCGGTIARRIKEGDEVSVLILGEGVASRFKDKSSIECVNQTSQLLLGMMEAHSYLGIKQVQTMDFSDNQFDTIPLLNIVKAIEQVIAILKPECVYTHHYSDLNIDHAITHRATLTATRPIGNDSVKTVLTYEVPSSTEWSFRYDFKPNVFVDITDTLETKVKAMESYGSETRKFPHPRSPESLRAIAFRWGTTVGVEAAEAFELIRGIR
jgi:LmbE family N-acetylglucosaminyl deacetylase